MAKIKDLIGQKFGRLTVLENCGNKKYCKCDCGKEVVCYQYNLERGTSTSCGCLRSYYAKKHALVTENQQANFTKNGVP